MSPKSVLLQTVHDKARIRRLSPRTEQVYRSWILRFIRHHGTRHPRDLGEPEVAAFLTHLASQRKVSASTQTQALCALLFLYSTVLGRPLGRLGEMRWAQSRARMPVVLSAAEVSAVLGQLDGVYWLVAMLLYGAGLRLMECLTLRVKDLDLARGEIRLRTTKGGGARVTMVPKSLVEKLKQHLGEVRRVHQRDAPDADRIPEALFWLGTPEVNEPLTPRFLARVRQYLLTGLPPFDSKPRGSSS